MTVSSLWKALDKGGSGKLVGAHQLASSTASISHASIVPATLAVDLSIWICESLTSFGLNEQNDNPPLHLVFTRVMKLLNLGVKLVVVMEGKQIARP